jgi:hypothetical protein
MGIVESLVSIALYVAAGGFLAAGMFLLGKGQPKELGAMVIALAFFQTVTICFLLSHGAGLQALMVVIFAYIWYTLGAALFLGTNLMILAHQLVIAGLMYAAITAYLARSPPAFFAIMTGSYALIIFLLAASIYAGRRAPWLTKVSAWVLIIEAFVTVFYPSCALILGLPLP